MPAPQAADLLAHFDFARESPAALRAGADTLMALLARHDLTPHVTWTTSHPDRSVAAAIVWVATAIALGVAGRHRRARALAGLIAALGVALGTAAVGGAFDAVLPARSAAQLEVVIAPRHEARREVVLGAHYDSKTDVFDHVGRARAYALAVVLAVLGLSVRRARAALPAAFLLAALAAGGGRASGARGHGIVDDAVACAMLIECAVQFDDQPLATTRVRCVWWSDEEVGAQGSREWTRAATLDSIPRVALNLECIGAGPRLAYAQREWAGTRWYAAPASLTQRLRAAAGPSLGALATPVVTDAGSLRRAGIDAVTLLGMDRRGGPPRGLHRPGDRLDAVDRDGLDAARTCVRRFVSALDAAD